mmetsp:Transcript_33381/g.38324  ORF Transcript_33381/g.38324 Transcript_33381/m.38324 type:complete len:84 (-) Transcript_33381:177-428(-)
MYRLAMSATRGSSGLGSVSRELIDSRHFMIVRAGLHWSFKMSKHILPCEFMFGWKIFVVKLTFGGWNGYFEGNVMFKKNTPFA